MKAILDKKVYTYSDVNSLPDGNYEIINGKMVPTKPAGFGHGSLVCTVLEILGKNLGSKGHIAVGEV